MKKLVLILLALMVLGAAGGAAWWKFGRRADHLALGRQMMASGDPRGAALELRNAVRDNPDSIEAHYRLGYTLLQLGDAVAAQKELERVQAMGGGEKDVPVLLAQSYLAQGLNKELVDKFRPPLSTPDLTSQLLLIRALALNTLGDQVAAMSSLATAEAASPRSASVPMTAARIALLSGDYTLALEKAEHALFIDPNRLDAMLTKAQVLSARGNRAAALDTLNQVLTLAPRYISARLERANLQLDLGQDKPARADVDEVLKAQPNAVPAVYLNAVLLTRAKQSAQADLEFQKLSGLMERFPRAYFFLALVKLDLGQNELALDNATRYMARHPGDPDGVKLLARIQLVSKRPDQAIATLTKAMRFGLADSEVLNILSQAYAATGQADAAAKTLTRAMAIAPQSHPITGGDADKVQGAYSDPSAGINLIADINGSDEANVINALRAGDVDAAGRVLDRLRAEQGNSEQVNLLNAAVLTMRQEYAAARRQYEEMLAVNPSLVAPRVGLAQLDQIEGRGDDAERRLADILTQTPADESALGVVMPILVNSGRMARAVSLLEAAFAAAPGNAKIGLALASIYLQIQAPDKALGVLTRMNPQAEAAPLQQQLVRAHALVALHREPEAIVVYRKMIALLPGEVSLVGELVGLQETQHDYAGARATLVDALKNQPGNLDFMRLQLGNELVSGGQAAAQQVIEAASANESTRPQSLILRADLALANGNTTEAAEMYAGLLRQTPSLALALKTATTYIQAGNPTEASATLSAWLAQSPKDLDALRLQANLQLGLDKNDAAIATLELLSALQPDDADTMNNLAWLYALKGDRRALPLARRAFVLRPSAQSADTLGWILVRANEVEGGLPLLAQAAKALNDPTVSYHYGFALSKLGKKDESLAVLQPLAEQSTAFPEQEDARRLVKDLRGGK